jgi:predicted ABC-type transport system involved in lysophospholipase L1 biosynthesis ATPase subunit
MLQKRTVPDRYDVPAAEGAEAREVDPVISARGIVKEFHGTGTGEQGVAALRGVDLRVQPGEWLAIVGPSGCGKSTLLNVLAGIDPPSAGSVHLLGHDLARLDDSARASLRLRQVGFVFQRFHLLAVLSASENVELVMAEAGVGKRERRERSLQLLDYVGLGHRLTHRPPQLSGGEQQRVAIARALANRPSIIFADEPTGELDRGTGAQILELFQRLNDDGTTLIVVTHDSAVAERADRMVEMSDGHIVRDRRRDR